MLGAEPMRLPADQLAKAIRNDSISIPTPGELFAALEKPGKPNWSGQYRGPIPTTYRNRAQIALNLGGLIADGFIAVEAQDSQQVKNIGTDIIKLAKALGVSVGGWIRGTQVVSAAVMQNYDERSAKVLRQPALVNFIHSKLNDISSDLHNEPLVKEVSDELGGIEKLVAFPPGKAPTAEDVKKVNEAVGKIMDQIQNKEAK